MTCLLADDALAAHGEADGPAELAAVELRDAARCRTHGDPARLADERELGGAAGRRGSGVLGEDVRDERRNVRCLACARRGGHDDGSAADGQLEFLARCCDGEA